MDLYNFYRGLENVIDTLQKDRDKLTMQDYLIMCDPFFNVDFYDEKYLNQHIGGAAPPLSEDDLKEMKENEEKKTEAAVKQAKASEVQIQQNAEEKKQKSQEELDKAQAEAKQQEKNYKVYKKDEKEAKKNIKKFTSEIKNIEKKIGKEKDEAKRDGFKAQVKTIQGKLKTEQDKYNDAKKKKEEAQGKAQGATAKAESSQSVTEEDVADAAADLDKEVDEMAAIKKLIKTATKVIVVFAIIVCLPIVPWIMISYYSFKKLHGLYISYIQTY